MQQMPGIVSRHLSIWLESIYDPIFITLIHRKQKRIFAGTVLFLIRIKKTNTYLTFYHKRFEKDKKINYKLPSQ